MRPKKTNTPIWRTVKKICEALGSPANPYGGQAYGYEIVDIQTGMRALYSVEVINKMIELNLIEYNQSTMLSLVTENPFRDVEHDLSFLDPYIDHRPTWDEFYMAQAQLYATRSTCGRLNVGAVLVQNNRMVAEGYNGSITDHPHCDEDNHLMYENGCKRTIHAEMNIITMCARDGISTKGGTIYVTHQPCPDCTKHLNQAGIKEIVFLYPYKHRYDNNFHEGMIIRQYVGKELEFTWGEKKEEEIV